MNWWQAVGTILLGNRIVLVPMLLNAHLARNTASVPVWYGRRSASAARISAVLRALVACGWFGIQT
jgi:NCS1 family nucleobase:cation symporter-1